MSVSENIIYLKDDSLFKIEDNAKRNVSLGEVLDYKDKYSLLIDDGYFFYIGIENVAVTGKKLTDIAANYLSIMFPGEMVGSFGIFQNKSFTVIFILSEKLSHLIKDNRELFASAKKISSPFLELAGRYEDFVFSDGERFYQKNGGNISIAPNDSPDFINASNLFEVIEEVKASVRLPGLRVSKFSKTPLIMPGIAAAVCYVIFLAGGIFSVSSVNNLDRYYENEVNKIYKIHGDKVAKSGDPMGMLSFKAGQTDSGGNGKRLIDVLADISSVEKEGAEFASFSMRDNAFRIDGSAKDFAQVDALKKNMEEKMKVPILMDDTKKTEKGVTFVMRFEQ